MQKTTTTLSARPILKDRPNHPRILSISPKPPTEHREPPALPRANISRNSKKRGNIFPRDVIDYDQLTPNQQAQWDAGCFGSLHLRADVNRPYWFIRWFDPVNKIQRSTKLGYKYEDAIDKRRQLTTNFDSV